MADVIDSINAVRDAVLAIEKELGVNPKKIYGNVRARLDILENRINNPSTPSPSTDNPFVIGTSGVTISAGTGAPVTVESSGSLYLRDDGANNERIYISDGTNWSQLEYLEKYKLTGSASAGAEVEAFLPGSTRFSINDDESCLVNIKLLAVTTSGVKQRAYFEYKVIISQDSGTLTIDDVFNVDLVTATTWSITVSIISNELSIKLDSSGSDDRKVDCILEVQRLSHI